MTTADRIAKCRAAIEQQRLDFGGCPYCSGEKRGGYVRGGSSHEGYNTPCGHIPESNRGKACSYWWAIKPKLQCLLDMLADVESGTDPSFEQLDLAGIVERGETGSGLYSEVRAYWLVLRQLAHIEKCLGVQHG